MFSHVCVQRCECCHCETFKGSFHCLKEHRLKKKKEKANLNSRCVSFMINTIKAGGVSSVVCSCCYSLFSPVLRRGCRPALPLPLPLPNTDTCSSFEANQLRLPSASKDWFIHPLPPARRKPSSSPPDRQCCYRLRASRLVCPSPSALCSQPLPPNKAQNLKSIL